MKENHDYPKWKLLFDLGKRNIEINEGIISELLELLKK